MLFTVTVPDTFLGHCCDFHVILRNFLSEFLYFCQYLNFQLNNLLYCPADRAYWSQPRNIVSLSFLFYAMDDRIAIKSIGGSRALFDSPVIQVPKLHHRRIIKPLARLD